MENFTLGIWKEYEDRSLNYWSDSLYEILDIDKVNGLSITSLLELVVEENLSLASQFFDQMHTGKENHLSASFRIKGKKSQPKDVFILAHRVENEKQESAPKWEGIVLDISSFHLRIDNGLEDLKLTLYRLPFPIICANASGEITFWNRETEQLTGFSKSAVTEQRRSLKFVIPEKERLNAVLALCKGSSKQKSISWKGTVETKEGEKRFVLWSTFLVPNANNPKSIILIGIDKTPIISKEKEMLEVRKTKDLLLNFSKQLLNFPISENIFQFLGTSLQSYSKGNIFFVFSAAPEEHFFILEGVFGLKQTETKKFIANLGWSPFGRRFQIFPEQYHALGHSGMVEATISKTEFCGDALSVTAAKAVERQLGVIKTYSMGLFHEDKLLGGVFFLKCRETTTIEADALDEFMRISLPAIIQHNREKRQCKKLEVALKAKEQHAIFLANLSHEIRTPLNAVLGFSKLLNIASLDDEVRQQYADIINDKGNLLLRLINDMADLAIIDTNELTLVKVPFSVSKLLCDVYDFYQKDKILQQRESIDIRLVLPPDSENLMFNGDEGRVEQVLSNLMSNALKFTEKGEISLGYTIKDDTLEFFVADTGIGIHPDFEPIIFDRYKYRVDTAGTPTKSTGLGLAISKNIVEIMGGEIGFSSELGKGTTFTFSLPYAKPAREKSISLRQLSKESASVDVDWKNKVILVAEDEETNYQYVLELLGPTGVKIIWAKNGRQAVELVNSIRKFDAVLMDIKMPIKDGYAATLEIRQINPDIPIIALTAYASMDDKKRALAAGCDKFVSKPINRKKLMEVLDEYLG